MLKATRFVILRSVESNSRKEVPLAERPLSVCTLVDEAKFREDNYLIHLRTVFFEDAMHDWKWGDGKFRYYPRVGDVADVLIVYETAEVEPEMNFDPMTGKRLEKAA